jgi:hypothetical protein
MVSFTWKKKDSEVNINTLQDLLETLISISIENIDREIKINVIEGNIISWVENNFPQKLILITRVKKAIEEYTSQQIREMLIRELKKTQS